MPDMAEAVDLKGEAQSRIALAALAALSDLGPGEARRILMRDDPALLMASLNLHLRDALSWETAPLSGHWETTVRPAADTAPRDPVKVLVRDHRRLDQLLGRALRRHAAVENDVIAPALAPAPVEEMLREHGDLLEQLATLEEAIGSRAEAESAALHQQVMAALGTG